MYDRTLLSNIKSNMMTHNNRVTIYKLLHNNIKNKNDCNDILSKEYTLLSEGGHSVNWTKQIILNNNLFHIALKIQVVKGYIIHEKFNTHHNLWREYDVLKKCTQLVLNSTTPNLPIIYDLEICPSKVIFYNELAKGSFINWIYKDNTSIEWESFLFQLWAGVHVMQKHLHLTHNDLRFGNILFHETNSVYKYTIDDEVYYVPCAYTFVIWDFGSSKVANSSIEQAKLDLNFDLHFFHDVYNRLRVLVLLNKYTSDELEKFFVSDEDKKYIVQTKDECERRFRRTGRYDEKCKISLIYYLIEHDKFEELYNAKQQNLSEHCVVKLPPPDIMMLLKDISENYNYDYNDIMNVNLNVKKIIPNPIVLIKKYFAKFLVKQKYDFEFTL